MPTDRTAGPQPFATDAEDEQTLRLPIPATRGLATVRVVAGVDMLRFVRLYPGEEALVGRDENADLRLTDSTVSKRHAYITVETSGRIRVQDLDSTNGVRVNGRIVGRATLRPGDRLEIGAVSLRVDMLSDEEFEHLRQVVSRLESANRDPLTGLLSRRFMDDELPGLADRCALADVPISCVFIDIDHFKRVNDGFGHQVGDEVLRAVARLVMFHVRDADPAIRYGGEELLLILPGSDESAATEVAERIRQRVADHDWERTASGLRVTISGGVSQRAPNEPAKDWINRADLAIYRAKRSGRNRIERASSAA